MSYRYLNEDAIDDELRCVICNEPFQSPVNCIDRWYRQQTSCPFCREKGYLFVPVITRILLNQLNRLLVQCSQCQQTNIQRVDFVDHLSMNCPRQKVTCPNECSWEGYRDDLEEHLISCRKNRRGFFRCM